MNTATPRPDSATARRVFLALVVAASVATYLPQPAFSQTDTESNPPRLPGQTITPDTKAKERDIERRAQEKVLQDRARERGATQQQQFQSDRDAATQRERAVQQNLDQQRLDILNNRDKP